MTDKKAIDAFGTVPLSGGNGRMTLEAMESDLAILLSMRRRWKEAGINVHYNIESAANAVDGSIQAVKAVRA